MHDAVTVDPPTTANTESRTKRRIVMKFGVATRLRPWQPRASTQAAKALAAAAILLASGCALGGLFRSHARQEIANPTVSIDPEASRIVYSADSTNYKVESLDGRGLCFWVGVLMTRPDAEKLSFELRTTSDPKASPSTWPAFQPTAVEFLAEYEAGYYTPEVETVVEQTETGELRKHEQFVAKKNPVSELRACFAANSVDDQARAMQLSLAHPKRPSPQPAVWAFPAARR